MKILEAKHIKKSFGGVTALIDANVSLKTSEICGLVGANGSGKTTFARIISGLLIPDGGELYLYNSQVNLKSHLNAEKFKLALVHQNLSLVPEMTIWENLNLGREKSGTFGFLDKTWAIKKAQQSIDNLEAHISIYEKVVNLSPDEKQLVEVAKALTKEPKILILDEPTASLGFKQVEKLFSTIKIMKEKDVSIIFISHRIWEITKICDRVIVFRNGKTVGEIDFERQERDERLIIPLITGKAEGILFRKEKKEEKKLLYNYKDINYVLEVENLSLKGKLKNISFKVKKGEILGIGGLQGQGQEELLLILAGFLHKSSGKIKVNGKYINIKNSRHAIKKGMFLVPGDKQKEGLFFPHTVFSNLTYPKISLRKRRFILPLGRLRKEADESIKAISLVPPDQNIIVSHLSGGNQQKIVVGKWLSLSPNILLLNDPTKGVDVETRNNLYAIISNLPAKGASVILYASDNDELISNCDRILIIFEGRIVDELYGEDICEDQIVASSLNISMSGEKFKFRIKDKKVINENKGNNKGNL
jgi:ribose transport system ATP-binding protein